MTPDDLERLVGDVQRCCVDTGCTCPAAKLLAALRSVVAERDACSADFLRLRDERNALLKCARGEHSYSEFDDHGNRQCTRCERQS